MCGCVPAHEFERVHAGATVTLVPSRHVCTHVCVSVDAPVKACSFLTVKPSLSAQLWLCKAHQGPERLWTFREACAVAQCPHFRWWVASLPSPGPGDLGFPREKPKPQKGEATAVTGAPGRASVWPGTCTVSPKPALWLVQCQQREKLEVPGPEWR